MPKRKKATAGGNNPLSDARSNKDSKKRKRHQQSKSSHGSSGIISRAELDARALWHRKSGAGYSLFVSYYGSQPPGAVVPATTTKRRDGEAEGGATGDDGINSKSGRRGRNQGQSRAAKRRRKKKKMGSGARNASAAAATPAESTNDEDEVKSRGPRFTEGSASQDAPAKQALSEELHPLLRALHSKRSRYGHLTPFLEALSRPLPLTFRLRRTEDAIDEATNQSSKERTERRLSEYSGLIAPVSYDPSKHIYQSKIASSQSNGSSPMLCKSNLSTLSPSLKSLLLEMSSNGTLARQELGSMLPVVALEGGGWLKPGSNVLDLCASPGSKTLQALEIVASPSSSSPDDDESASAAGRDGHSHGKMSSGGGGGGMGNEKRTKKKKRKRGRVVANDIHSGRLDQLKEAVRRSGLPDKLTSRITYTNFDASTFPSPRSGTLFDAVLADVPCSGDGTIRKDGHVLPMWTPNTANALHGLQVRILVRALELVRVGGVVCYSTCSLNPVEDEAVVAAALRRFIGRASGGKGGPAGAPAGAEDDGDDERREVESQRTAVTPAVELVPWPGGALPGLVRREGVKRWRIADYVAADDDDRGGDGGDNKVKKNGREEDEDEEGADEEDDFGRLRWHDGFADVAATDDDGGRRSRMAHAERTMWPPQPPAARNDDDDRTVEDDDLHLDRCVRLWPQDQDTGGFFLALIRKNRSIS